MLSVQWIFYIWWMEIGECYSGALGRCRSVRASGNSQIPRVYLIRWLFC